MSIFQQLAGINFAGSIHLTIEKSGEDLVVFVLPKNDAAGNKAAGSIPPLSLRGTPEELDAGFIDAIRAPVERVSGLVQNVEAFNKAAQEAEVEAAKTKTPAAATKSEPKAKATRGKKTGAAPNQEPETTETATVEKPITETPVSKLIIEAPIVSPDPAPVAPGIENDEVHPETKEDLFSINDDDDIIED